MTFQIKCDKCGSELETDEKYIGQAAECPNCHHRIIISSSIDNEASEQVETITSEQVELKVTEQTEQIIKYCPKCGESVRPQARFCIKCGAPISYNQSIPATKASSDMGKTASSQKQKNISSSTITIERSGQILGPFDYGQFKEMFKTNKLYLNDITHINDTGELLTLRKALKRLAWEYPEGKSVGFVFRKIGIDFLLPWKSMGKASEYKHTRFIYMCIVGLIPLFLILVGEMINLTIGIVYLGFAAYFTLLWAMFFWSILDTEQIQIKQCLKCFFMTFFISMTLLGILQGIGIFDFLEEAITSSSMIVRIIGNFFFTGLPEEICKALSIFWLLNKRGKLFPIEAIVFYGIFSGLAFGIKEGLMYQQGSNRNLQFDLAYFYNLLRLTSLPFLHAIWCGISSYFLAFAGRYPMYRYWLSGLAILLPAMLHATYNAGTVNLLGIIIPVITIFLFLFYYRNIKTLETKLQD